MSTNIVDNKNNTINIIKLINDNMSITVSSNLSVIESLQHLYRISINVGAYRLVFIIQTLSKLWK